MKFGWYCSQFLVQTELSESKVYLACISLGGPHLRDGFDIAGSDDVPVITQAQTLKDSGSQDDKL